MRAYATGPRGPAAKRPKTRNLWMRPSVAPRMQHASARLQPSSRGYLGVEVSPLEIRWRDRKASSQGSWSSVRLRGPARGLLRRARSFGRHELFVG